MNLPATTMLWATAKAIRVRSDVLPRLIGRFFAKVEIGHVDDCWIWRGATGPGGYGHFSIGVGRTVYPHRFIYEFVHGLALSQHLTIDHLCCETRCVNPRHLEPVTIQENLRRGRERRKAMRA